MRGKSKIIICKDKAKWVKIKEIEGNKVGGRVEYFINNYGEIISMDSSPRLLKHSISKTKSNGGKYKSKNYEYVRLQTYINGELKNKQYYIHRLLALFFIPVPYKYRNIDDLVVNHIDGNSMNNNLDNLEWNTQKENSNDGIRDKRFYNTRKLNKEIELNSMFLFGLMMGKLKQ